MQVICHLAERLVELHAAGIVHRDLKPANVMWLPSQNRWTVIDFGCVAATHHPCSLAYTLRYAAPEVIAAKRSSGKSTIVVEESLDAWSLGVMAFEMATGTPGCAFKKEMSSCNVRICCDFPKGFFLPTTSCLNLAPIRNTCRFPLAHVIRKIGCFQLFHELLQNRLLCLKV